MGEFDRRKDSVGVVDELPMQPKMATPKSKPAFENLSLFSTIERFFSQPPVDDPASKSATTDSTTSSTPSSPSSISPPPPPPKKSYAPGSKGNWGPNSGMTSNDGFGGARGPDVTGAKVDAFPSPPPEQPQSSLPLPSPTPKTTVVLKDSSPPPFKSYAPGSTGNWGPGKNTDAFVGGRGATSFAPKGQENEARPSRQPPKSLTPPPPAAAPVTPPPATSQQPQKSFAPGSKGNWGPSSVGQNYDNFVGARGAKQRATPDADDDSTFAPGVNKRSWSPSDDNKSNYNPSGVTRGAPTSVVGTGSYLDQIASSVRLNEGSRMGGMSPPIGQMAPSPTDDDNNNKSIDLRNRNPPAGERKINGQGS